MIPGLSQWCQKSFVDWGEQALGEGAQRFWTGIVCATRDTLPLVGEVPNQKGLWICVGFQGEHIHFHICPGLSEADASHRSRDGKDPTDDEVTRQYHRPKSMGCLLARELQDHNREDGERSEVSAVYRCPSKGDARER